MCTAEDPRTRRRGAGAGPVAMLAAGAFACGGPEPRPNVVFVSVDTLSARHLSLYGYERATSPELDRLAREAVVFEHCLANSPWSVPSYLSQLTGLYPLVFRRESTEDAPMPLHWTLPDGAESLAELAQREGYRTAAFVDNPLLSDCGFERGFEVFDTEAAGHPVEDPDGGARLLFPRVVDWLDRLPDDRPFFLFVNLFDVHGPYVAPGGAQGTFDPEALPEPAGELPVAKRHGFIHGAVSKAIAAPYEAGRAAPETLSAAALAAAYDDQVVAVDAEIGAFLDVLRERALLEGSLVVVSADHGEAWGRGDTYFAHQSVHGDDLHVPLIVRLPGGEAGGTRVAADVQLVDLAPTLADYLGLELPAGHGRSLRPWIEGESLEVAPILSEVPLLRARSVVYDGWKLVRYRVDAETATPLALLSHPRVREWTDENAPEFADGVYGTHGFPDDRFVRSVGDELAAAEELTEPVYELYDLRADPLEQNDVAHLHPERVEELRALLERERQRALALRDELGTGSEALSPPDEQLLERMRALGYVGDDP